jgi:hypothetical protein
MFIIIITSYQTQIIFINRYLNHFKINQYLYNFTAPWKYNNVKLLNHIY